MNIYGLSDITNDTVHKTYIYGNGTGYQRPWGDALTLHTVL